MNSHWIANCINDFLSLEGRIVERVFIVEMALIEQNQDGEPVFEHANCPFLQASCLYLRFCDGEIVKVFISQTENWSLCPTFVDYDIEFDDVERKANSIFRNRDLNAFPRGKISFVSILQAQNGDISEVRLTIASDTVLLKSGEVYENTDGTLKIVNDDESVLVFLNASDIDKVTFNNFFL